MPSKGSVGLALLDPPYGLKPYSLSGGNDV